MGAFGTCKVCNAGPLTKEIDKRLKAMVPGGQRYEDVSAWSAAQGFPVTRQKLAEHKRLHLTSKKAQSILETVRLAPDQVEQVTNDQYLSLLRDLGYQNALANPSSVPPSLGLKAVQTIEARREKQINVLMLLADAFTGKVPELIDGSWKELPMQENS